MKTNVVSNVLKRLALLTASLGALTSCGRYNGQGDFVSKAGTDGISLNGTSVSRNSSQSIESDPLRIKLVDAAIYFKFAKNQDNNDRVIGDKANPPVGYIEEPGTSFWLPVDTKYQLGGKTHSSLKLIYIMRNDFAEGSHLYTDDAVQAERAKAYGAVNALWTFLFNTNANGGSPLYLFRCDLVGRFSIGFEPKKFAPYGCKVEKTIGYVLRK